MPPFDGSREPTFLASSSSDVRPQPSGGSPSPASLLAYPGTGSPSTVPYLPPESVYVPFGDVYTFPPLPDAAAGQPWPSPSTWLATSAVGASPSGTLPTGLAVPLSPGLDSFGASTPPGPSSTGLTVGGVLSSFPSPSTSNSLSRADTLASLAGTSDSALDDHVVGAPLGVTPRIKPFITKLWHLLAKRETYQDCAVWDAAGEAFIINSNKRFVDEVLPRVFGHRNVASFTRQLHVYDFRRLTRQELVARVDIVSMEGYSAWTHPDIKRDDKSKLHLMLPRPSRARALKKAAKRERIEREGAAGRLGRVEQSKSVDSSPLGAVSSASPSPVYTPYAPLPVAVEPNPPLPTPQTGVDEAHHASRLRFPLSASTTSATSIPSASLVTPVNPPANTLGLLLGAKPYSLAPSSRSDIDLVPSSNRPLVGCSSTSL